MLPLSDRPPHRWSRREWLETAGVVWLGALPRVAQPAIDIRIASAAPESLGDYGLGLQLGGREAERMATLLGHRFALVTNGPALARVARTTGEAHEAAVLVAMDGTPDAPCVFVTSSTEEQRVSARRAAHAHGEVREVIDWHPAFRRYGASELNERFVAAFGQPMTAGAWHGWVAIKAIAEAAIRGGDLCAALKGLRFDGHKGRALSFDPRTRRLRQPVLIVRDDGEIEMAEVIG